MGQLLRTPCGTAWVARAAIAEGFATSCRTPGAAWLDLGGAVAVSLPLAGEVAIRLRAPLHMVLSVGEGSPAGRVALQGQEAPWARGLHVVPAGATLEGSARGPHRLRALLLSPARLRLAARAAGIAPACPAAAAGLEDACLASLVAALDGVCREGGTASSAAGQAAASAIATRLSEGHAAAGMEPDGALPAWRLARLEAFLDERLGGAVGHAEMAAAAGVAPGGFARALQVATGLSPAAFLRRRRCLAAARLIAEGRLPLAEIALECGFGSQSRLSDAFAAAFGAPPARWRRAREAGVGAASGQGAAAA